MQTLRIGLILEEKPYALEVYKGHHFGTAWGQNPLCWYEVRCKAYFETVQSKHNRHCSEEREEYPGGDAHCCRTQVVHLAVDHPAKSVTALLEAQ